MAFRERLIIISSKKKTLSLEFVMKSRAEFFKIKTDRNENLFHFCIMYWKIKTVQSTNGV